MIIYATKKIVKFSGAFGVVYKGIILSSDAAVAIKTLKGKMTCW